MHFELPVGYSDHTEGIEILFDYHTIDKSI